MAVKPEYVKYVDTTIIELNVAHATIHNIIVETANMLYYLVALLFFATIVIPDKSMLDIVSLFFISLMIFNFGRVIFLSNKIKALLKPIQQTKVEVDNHVKP